MKSSLGASVAIHTAVLSCLFLGAGLTASPQALPVIVRVNMVEAVPAPEPPAETPPPETAPAEEPRLDVRRPEPSRRDVKVPDPAEPRPLAEDQAEEVEETEPPAPPPQPPPEPKPSPPRPEPERPRGASTTITTDSAAFAEYAYYRVAMRNKISSLWAPPHASTELACTVHFRIVRSGAVIGARVERSSGLPFFDHTALRAVVEASPLPPLPADFPDDVVGVFFEFAYKP